MGGLGFFFYEVSLTGLVQDALQHRGHQVISWGVLKPPLPSFGNRRPESAHDDDVLLALSRQVPPKRTLPSLCSLHDDVLLSLSLSLSLSLGALTVGGGRVLVLDVALFLICC